MIFYFYNLVICCVHKIESCLSLLNKHAENFKIGFDTGLKQVLILKRCTTKKFHFYFSSQDHIVMDLRDALWRTKCKTIIIDLKII